MGNLAAAWGIAGVSLLLASAIGRLSAVAWQTLSVPLHPRHWVGLAVSIVVMGVVEGYYAFQRQFSPRVAARARHLANHPTLARTVLAPLFCMGFFGAPRRRRLASAIVTSGIVVLVLLVKRIDQPWRGIIDAGVVIALAWGLAALWIFTARAFGPQGLDHPAEVVP